MRGALPRRPGVLYTDGVTEAARADQEMFGEERLARLVESLPRDFAAREVVEAILRDVHQFLGDTEAGDDITVMVLRVMPAEGHDSALRPGGRAPDP